MPPPVSPGHSLTREAAFYTTRWSVVIAAREKAKGNAMESLETLCRQYWPPLYAYVRQRGHPAPDAQDLTQAFFARLLEKEWLLAVDRDKGRFRSFLLMAMKRFLANDWDRSQTRKRGGGLEFISLDAGEAGHLGAAGRMAAMPADSLYEKRWALTVLENVMGRLRLEHEEAGRLEEYETLKPWLTADRGGIPYDQLAAALKMEPASARSAMHRLRKRFRGVFREEVAGTVADPSEVEDEMRAVVAALARD